MNQSLYPDQIVKNMESIGPPDSHRIRAAHGWLGLNNCLEAQAELELLSADLKLHPEVLELRWKLSVMSKQWGTCIEISEQLMHAAPSKPEGWIQKSFALDASGRSADAYDTLISIVPKFPNVWRIPYNLSCYCAKAGNFGEAEDWFKKAISLDKVAVQRLAIDDPDLKPLWDSMSNTMWKRTD
jgi:tetratricopeptide (TPR) repeat protein